MLYVHDYMIAPNNDTVNNITFDYIYTKYTYRHALDIISSAGERNREEKNIDRCSGGDVV